MDDQPCMPSFIHGLPMTQAAVAYAKRAHDGQRRRVDGAPFIEHPLEVASLLYCAGAPDHLIAAGVLHDTIEKTHVVASDLRERFGSRVATLVLAVSEDEHITGYAQRKAALREQVGSRRRGGADRCLPPTSSRRSASCAWARRPLASRTRAAP